MLVGMSRGTQGEVCEHVARPLVEAVLDRRTATNVTLFAYGQTGSGKTYTMEGTEEVVGIMHYAVQALFTGLSNDEDIHFQYVSLFLTGDLL